MKISLFVALCLFFVIGVSHAEAARSRYGFSSCSPCSAADWSSGRVGQGCSKKTEICEQNQWEVYGPGVPSNTFETASGYSCTQPVFGRVEVCLAGMKVRNAPRRPSQPLPPPGPYKLPGTLMTAVFNQPALSQTPQTPDYGKMIFMIMCQGGPKECSISNPSACHC